MASKAEIVKEISELDASVSTEGLNHEALTKLLSEVKEAQASDTPDADKELDEAVEALAKASGIYVCKGKSITSKKGMLNGGSGPYEASLFGDKANLTRLVKLGCLEVVK